MEDEHPSKRRRVACSGVPDDNASTSDHSSEPENAKDCGAQIAAGRSPLKSLHTDVSPPLGPTSIVRTSSSQDKTNMVTSSSLEESKTPIHPVSNNAALSSTRRCVPSPISLTHVQDLHSEHNIDAVSLGGILGDPLIKEAWIFNYLHDVSFTMSHFDPDVRDIVQVKVVHGSWKREDTHRLSVEADAKQYKNVQVITAHMPEMFGTHHSKAIILIRHDDSAQVIIHTANMIAQDWTNMTQAVWRSPILPLLGAPESTEVDKPVESGLRFKLDLLNYLRAYQGRTKTLVEQLEGYDFQAVRAALIASVPCKQSIDAIDARKTRFGWSGLRQILKSVPAFAEKTDASQIVVQISSIGNLGAKDKWFDPFLKTLAVTAAGDTSKLKPLNRPEYHVIFPTADEVRRSLDGYASGASIHMKLENKAMQSQLAYMRPMLRHWAGSETDKDHLPGLDEDAQATSPSPLPPEAPEDRKAHHHARRSLRRRAAPHIKTYVRFSDANMTSIEWAMLTSANLSKQAWGDAAKEGSGGSGREIRIASYELGVVVWPALFADVATRQAQDASANRDGKTSAVMVPVFGRDAPEEGAKLDTCQDTSQDAEVTVGFRMPYDLPFARYKRGEVPWCATAEHLEPDWKGVVWHGYSRRA